MVNSMSFHNSSSVVQCQSDQFDSINLTTTSSSTITFSSPSIADSLSGVYKFTTERITRLLKTDSSNYKVIEDPKSNLFSACWKAFSFSGKESHVKEEFETSDFVSCQSDLMHYFSFQEAKIVS